MEPRINAERRGCGTLQTRVASGGRGRYLNRVKRMDYVVYREDEFFVAQCLNVDVSSFGANREEAAANLKEAVEFHFEGEPGGTFTPVNDAVVGQELVDA